MTEQKPTELLICVQEIAKSMAKYAQKNPNFLNCVRTFFGAGLSVIPQSWYAYRVGEMFLDSIKEAEKILKHQDKN